MSFPLGEVQTLKREAMRQRGCSERRGSPRSSPFGVTFDGRNRRAGAVLQPSNARQIARGCREAAKEERPESNP